MTTNMPDCPEGGRDTIYEYYVSAAQKNWTHWSSQVPTWTYPDVEPVKFHQLIIPTLDFVRYAHVVGMYLKKEKPALLIGKVGTTKTATVLQILGKMQGEDFTSKNVTFSSATTPLIFQRTIEGCVEKRSGKTFGPPGSKKAAVFIDDVNMPEINIWGDQITNEIVRQQIEMCGLYNLEKPGEWKSIIDLLFVAAMCHPGGGKNDIPNRLKRHFAVLNITMPSITSIDNIYGTMIRGRFKVTGPHRMPADVVNAAVKLTDLSIVLWQRVCPPVLLFVTQSYGHAKHA
jgi:dynein heavy chain